MSKSLKNVVQALLHGLERSSSPSGLALLGEASGELASLWSASPSPKSLHPSQTIEQWMLDALAIHGDWRAVGHELYRAMQAVNDSRTDIPPELRAAVEDAVAKLEPTRS